MDIVGGNRAPASPRAQALLIADACGTDTGGLRSSSLLLKKGYRSVGACYKCANSADYIAALQGLVNTLLEILRAAK